MYCKLLILNIPMMNILCRMFTNLVWLVSFHLVSSRSLFLVSWVDRSGIFMPRFLLRYDQKIHLDLGCNFLEVLHNSPLDWHVEVVVKSSAVAEFREFRTHEELLMWKPHKNVNSLNFKNSRRTKASRNSWKT